MYREMHDVRIQSQVPVTAEHISKRRDTQRARERFVRHLCLHSLDLGQVLGG